MAPDFLYPLPNGQHMLRWARQMLAEGGISQTDRLQQ